MPVSRLPPRDTKSLRRSRRWPLVLAGIIVLAAAAAFVLPASLISRTLPPQIRAEDFSGTLMHGAAGRLQIYMRDAGAIEWRIHPLSLLRLAVVADVHWVKVGFVIDGAVELGAHRIAAHDIRGVGPIEDLADLGLAVGWKGTAALTVAELRSDYHRLERAEGRIEASNLTAVNIAQGSELGGYVLQLLPNSVAPDGTILATLNDTGGPLEAQAQIHFSPSARNGMLSGTLKERPEAAAALRNQLSSLSQLRPRDAQGRFPVELEFTF